MAIKARMTTAASTTAVAGLSVNTKSIDRDHAKRHPRDACPKTRVETSVDFGPSSDISLKPIKRGERLDYVRQCRFDRHQRPPS
jgi:hypothetical protein